MADQFRTKVQRIQARWRGVPLIVFYDAETGRQRSVNGLHIQTFIPNPFGDRKGTLITFASGDTVTVTDDFDRVFEMLSGFVVDG